MWSNRYWHHVGSLVRMEDAIATRWDLDLVLHWSVVGRLADMILIHSISLSRSLHQFQDLYGDLRQQELTGTWAQKRARVREQRPCDCHGPREETMRMDWERQWAFMTLYQWNDWTTMPVLSPTMPPTPTLASVCSHAATKEELQAQPVQITTACHKWQKTTVEK